MLMLIEPHITLPHKEDTITQYSMQLVLVEKGQTSLVATYCIDQMVLSLYWHSSFIHRPDFIALENTTIARTKSR